MASHVVLYTCPARVPCSDRTLHHQLHWDHRPGVRSFANETQSRGHYSPDPRLTDQFQGWKAAIPSEIGPPRWAVEADIPHRPCKRQLNSLSLWGSAGGQCIRCPRASPPDSFAVTEPALVTPTFAADTAYMQSPDNGTRAKQRAFIVTDILGLSVSRDFPWASERLRLFLLSGKARRLFIKG